MSTTTTVKTEIPQGLDSRVLARLLEESYGPGAWHGNDLQAALADVTPEAAFWRPAPERHNIAEIALHHAYYVHSVRGRLTGTTPEPFVLEGGDWFALAGAAGPLDWPQVRAVVEEQQVRLAAVVANLPVTSLSDNERFDLVLGITCHAIYHAGQIQLLKRLQEA
jgi:hypothetical protein